MAAKYVQQYCKDKETLTQTQVGEAYVQQSSIKGWWINAYTVHNLYIRMNRL